MVYWKSKRLRRYFYFALNAPENFLERELVMKGWVREGGTFPYSFPFMVAKLGKSERLQRKLSSVKETIAQPSLKFWNHVKKTISTSV